VRLLLIEDDPEIVGYLKTDLAKAGFAVDIANNGLDGEFLGDNEPYDIVVLDLGLPQKNGMDILQAWRKKGNLVPVIVLTARDAWYERVDGFKAGADDYLGKPFHVEELIARTRALISRKFRLLRYMMLNNGKILSKSNLSDHVYDQDSDRDSNLIEVYIRRLREKIGNKLILTKRGQGYVFNDPR